MSVYTCIYKVLVLVLGRVSWLYIVLVYIELLALVTLYVGLLLILFLLVRTNMLQASNVVGF